MSRRNSSLTPALSGKGGGGKKARVTARQWLKHLETQLDLESLMQGSCRAFMELTGADRCSIMVLDADTQQLTVRWAEGTKVKSKKRMRFRLGEGLCGTVATSQKSYCSMAPERESRFVPQGPKPGRGFRPVKAICCLPLVADGQTVGVVNLSSFTASKRLLWARRPQAIRFLDRLARVIAQAALLREAQALSSRWRTRMRTLSETFSQVSHEVRTPLTLIQEGSQQMLDGLAGPLSREQRKRVELIRRQAGRMLKLVTELLDISRLEAGHLPLRRRSVDLGRLIGEIHDAYRDFVAPRSFEMNLEPTPPVYGDPVRLSQVIENLVTNAVKYTPPEGAIRLKLSPHGRFAVAQVLDTGIGIPKKEQRRLFEKFYRPTLPATLGPRGTGLGLAITKEIVQLHGGTIRVDSKPGRGTAVIVSLPLYSPAFALTEEFRVMRQQAARDGQALVLQMLRFRGEGKESEPGLEALAGRLARQVSTRDRVMKGPAKGVVLLSIMRKQDFERVLERLRNVLQSGSSGPLLEKIRWGWAFVPEEETDLAGALRRAERRAAV